MRKAAAGLINHYAGVGEQNVVLLQAVRAAGEYETLPGLCMPLCFATVVKPIKAGDELLTDYGPSFDFEKNNKKQKRVEQAWARRARVKIEQEEAAAAPAMFSSLG